MKEAEGLQEDPSACFEVLFSLKNKKRVLMNRGERRLLVRFTVLNSVFARLLKGKKISTAKETFCGIE